LSILNIISSLQQRLANEDVTEESESVEPVKTKEKKSDPKKEVKALEKKMEQTQSEIAKLETEISELNQKLMDGHGNVSEMTEHMARNSKAIEELEATWLEMSNQRDSLNS
jgi:chromosome segregation ATPase